MTHADAGRPLRTNKADGPLILYGFAAGAMIFVISNEIVPETHRKGGLMVGLALMLVLAAAFT